MTSTLRSNLPSYTLPTLESPIPLATDRKISRWELKSADLAVSARLSPLGSADVSSMLYVGKSSTSRKNSLLDSSKRTLPKTMLVPSNSGVKVLVVIPKVGATSKMRCVRSPLELCLSVLVGIPGSTQSGATRMRPPYWIAVEPANVVTSKLGIDPPVRRPLPVSCVCEMRKVRLGCVVLVLRAIFVVHTNMAVQVLTCCLIQ